MPPLNDALVDRLYAKAKGERWHLPVGVFGSALERSIDRRFTGRDRQPREIERYVASLHLEDLALACACAEGHDEAWDLFVREYRPILYRAADTLGPAAREQADSLYADLYGLPSQRAGTRASGTPVGEREGERQSLFRYFHGRSSLATWLRAVLSQRYVDSYRSQRRHEPLPDEDSATVGAAAPGSPEPDRPRYLALMRRALTRALALLDPRDRLRLDCYYVQQLTLAEIGRVLREHEATVSRHLMRTRRAIRHEVERRLRDDDRLDAPQIARCFECVVEDPGPLDLEDLFGSGEERKKRDVNRSKE